MSLESVALYLLLATYNICTSVKLCMWDRERVYVSEAPAVAVNTNEIIPQREPETLPVGISVHVILICSNPFRDNPNLSPSFPPMFLSLYFFSHCLYLLSRCWTSWRYLLRRMSTRT